VAAAGVVAAPEFERVSCAAELHVARPHGGGLIARRCAERAIRRVLEARRVGLSEQLDSRHRRSRVRVVMIATGIATDAYRERARRGPAPLPGQVAGQSPVS